MKVLHDLRRKVAKTRQATKLFGRDVKSRLRNQFTKRNIGTFDANVAKNKAFAELGYVPLSDTSTYEQKLKNTGYQLDPSMSTEESKVFHNPTTKEVTVAYRGTALNKPSRWKDLRSDWAILTGREKHDRRFRQANHHFKEVSSKYADYKIDMTGHSLGGQIAKHVNDSHKGRVRNNVVFSRGSGLLEPFRKKQHNTVDVSNKNDLISMGARLQGGHYVVESEKKGLLASHNLGALWH